jgi:hypothetical protein
VITVQPWQRLSSPKCDAVAVEATALPLPDIQWRIISAGTAELRSTVHDVLAWRSSNEEARIG